MQETQVQSLGQKEPLEKGMATHCSILGASLVVQTGERKADLRNLDPSVQNMQILSIEINPLSYEMIISLVYQFICKEKEEMNSDLVECKSFII